MTEMLIADYRDAIVGMPDESFDCIMADPPYQETNLKWDRSPAGWPSHLRRLLKKTGSMWVFGSQRMFLERVSEFVGWDFVQDIVWEKHNGSSLNNDRFRRVHELALHFRRSDSKWADVFRSPQVTLDAAARTIRKKGRPAHWHGAEKGEVIYKTEDGGPKLMRSVIFARSEHGRAVHPTQKPLVLVEPLLRYSCPPGGRVLDPFAGSGTTGVVAARHGIQATLIESDVELEPVIRARLADDAPLLSAFHERAAGAWSEAGR